MAQVAVIRPEDLRLVMSNLASTFAAPLSQANLNAGKSWRPTAAILPEIEKRFVRQGPQAFTGHEWSIAANQREVQRDLQFSLSFALNSWLAAWAPAFVLQDISSVQEGATGRYTHTIKPVNLLGSGAGMQAKLTDLFIDSGSADANRRKGIYLALAVVRFSISCRIGENCQISMDFAGSGKDDIATSITVPALSTEVMLGGEQWKFERGDQGGALTDFTERVREWSFEVSQEISLDRGYIPNAATPADGIYRSQFRVLRRRFQFSWNEDIDRANYVTAGGLQARMKAQTRTETKITVDSGVVAGSSTTNHKLVLRVPDHRIPLTQPGIDADGASFAVSVPNELIYPDTGIGSVPAVITVDNDQASYLT